MSDAAADDVVGPETSPLPAEAPGPRLWPATVILVGSAAAIITFRLMFPDDGTARNTRVYPTVGLTLLLLLAWWLLFSRTRLVTRCLGLLVPPALLGLFLLLFRPVDMDGSAFPIFQPRWWPTRDEMAADYFKQNLADIEADHSTEGDNEDAPEPVEITARDWPGFRGHDRDGIVNGVRIRTDWESEPPQELWRHPVGRGWSSFAVVDKYAITQEQHEAFESVICYDATTGEPLWIHKDKTRFDSVAGGDGPRATPTIDQGHVFTVGATGLVTCLELTTGELIWQRNALDDARAKNLAWGISVSPWVDEEKVYVIAGIDPDKPAEEDSSVIAYDRKSGKILWKNSTRPASYAAPRIDELDGVPTLLVFGGRGLAGLDPESGAEWWFYPWPTDYQINASQPIVFGGNRVLVSSGYAEGSAVIELNRNAAGEFPSQPKVIWKKTNQFKCKFNDPVRLGGYAYGLDEGILSCIDLATGKRKWKRGRYGYGQLLLFAEQELLVVITERGELVLVDADPDRFSERERIPVLTEKTWNHLAWSRGKLYIRNAAEAVCLELGVRGESPAPQKYESDQSSD